MRVREWLIRATQPVEGTEYRIKYERQYEGAAEAAAVGVRPPASYETVMTRTDAVVEGDGDISLRMTDAEVWKMHADELQELHGGDGLTSCGGSCCDGWGPAGTRAPGADVEEEN